MDVQDKVGRLLQRPTNSGKYYVGNLSAVKPTSAAAGVDKYYNVTTRNGGGGNIGGFKRFNAVAMGKMQIIRRSRNDFPLFLKKNFVFFHSYIIIIIIIIRRRRKRDQTTSFVKISIVRVSFDVNTTDDRATRRFSEENSGARRKKKENNIRIIIHL